MPKKTAIIYPPLAYPYMPYMAPYLLKGYVEDNSEHTVDCIDLNIDFYNELWKGNLFSNYEKEIVLLGNRKILLSELIALSGKTAFDALRQQKTYDSEGTDLISSYHFLLRSAKQLMHDIDHILVGEIKYLPDNNEQWDNLIKKTQNTIAGEYISQISEKKLVKYDVVCFSCTYIEQLSYCLVISKILKKFKPSIKILIGGGAFTHILDGALKDLSFWNYIDIGIPYEGEFSFLEVLNNLDNKINDLSKLKNIVFKIDNKIIYEKDLKIRPKIVASPNYITLEHKFPTPEPIIPILTSKGCYWGKCAFCTHHEGYGEGYFAFGGKEIKDSLKSLVAQGFSSFYLVDEALPPKMVWRLAEIFQEIKTETNTDKEIRWMAESRAEKNFCGDDYINALKNSGCRLLFNGIESGSQRVVDLMKKGIDLKTAEILLKKCKEVGIRTGWMFFIGFPGETEDEAQETFDYIRNNKSYLDYATVGTFSLEKGSPIMENPEDWDIQPIIDKENKYQIIIPYAKGDIKENGIFLRNNIKEQLSILLKSNSDLLGLFTKLPERSVGLFLPKEDIKFLDKAPTIRWKSNYLKKEIVFDLKTLELKILKKQNESC
ncbi:hypothetical protein CS557_08220 [Acinetobacter junii]|uniref:B12-binding domain-containing radical SAM protein n=1 Tax=Acinetobacter junii TaxID=40215 RepID=UPI000C1B064B|nr:B12-binding domain-containing radical SAM protein [Acinetobacter junii]ATU45457.1 hypothetical protein CS557_08220 [Acinetobacter junii]